jgi:DNA repair exonuclease SbcCD ATPase subunit
MSYQYDIPYKRVIELLNERAIQVKLATEALQNNRITIAKEKSIIKNLQKAKAIIIQVGEQTQHEVKKYIEETVTLALQSVYGNDYEFVIEFSYDKREQFEVSFYIRYLKILLEPRKDTCGGGIIDVCSFALRLICLTLEKKNIASVLILDEPFKNVSSNYLPAVGQMVVDICELLNLQIIMVTHIDGFIETAGNIIYL